jgi:hypothetical protein
MVHVEKNDTLWCGDAAGAIHTYNAKTFELLHTVQAHSRSVNSLVVVENATIWAASDDGVISVWNVHDVCPCSTLLPSHCSQPTRSDVARGVVAFRTASSHQPYQQDSTLVCIQTKCLELWLGHQDSPVGGIGMAAVLFVCNKHKVQSTSLTNCQQSRKLVTTLQGFHHDCVSSIHVAHSAGHGHLAWSCSFDRSVCALHLKPSALWAPASTTPSSAEYESHCESHKRKYDDVRQQHSVC